MSLLCVIWMMWIEETIKKSKRIKKMKMKKFILNLFWSELMSRQKLTAQLNFGYKYCPIQKRNCISSCRLLATWSCWFSRCVWLLDRIYSVVWVKTNQLRYFGIFNFDEILKVLNFNSKIKIFCRFKTITISWLRVHKELERSDLLKWDIWEYSIQTMIIIISKFHRILHEH